MVLDTHVHFWKYSKEEYAWIDKDMKILQKNYLPADLEQTLKRNHVDGCIAVQAVHSELESRFLAELAITHPIVKGVIAWTDLRAHDAEKKLSELKAYAPIVGLRHLVQSEPDDFLYDEQFRAGVSLLQTYDFTFDLLIYSRQLKAAADLVRAFPDQQFILDHCAKPEIRHREMDAWKKGITEIAMYPNVVCKLSGLTTEAKWSSWSPADFYPYLDVVFQSFGAERLLFGSDWPVMLLSCIYVQWKSLLEKYMSGFLPEERENVFGLNAQRVYRL